MVWFNTYDLMASLFSIGRHGFLLPADQIVPNSLEVIDGLVAMVKEAEKLKYMH